MAFKQARTFTFTEMNVFSDFCQCDRVHVILFYVREDFADPFIFCEIRCGRKRLMWEMFYEQPPHDLHPDRYVQFVEIRLFFIKGDDFQHFFAESFMPAFCIVDVHRTDSKILDHRFYIFRTDGALEKSIDQLWVKSDRYIGTILLVLHFAAVEGVGIAENNVPFFQVEGLIIYTIVHGAFFYISDLDFRMVVPHKGIGIIF